LGVRARDGRHHSRLAYAEVFQGGGENARQAVAFLRRGVAFFKTHGQRVMSDNGSGYVSKAHAIAWRALGVRHTLIRPSRPRTNGKASALATGCCPVGR
jgi:transposase InsO family protein